MFLNARDIILCYMCPELCRLSLQTLVRPLLNSVTSGRYPHWQNLDFLVCEMEVIIKPASQVATENKQDNACKTSQHSQSAQQVVVGFNHCTCFPPRADSHLHVLGEENLELVCTKTNFIVSPQLPQASLLIFVPVLIRIS